MSRSTGKGRTDLFEGDGLVLNTKELRFYNTNITNSLKECYVNLKLLEEKAPNKRGKSDHKSVGISGTRGDRDGCAGHVQGKNRGRSKKRWGTRKKDEFYSFKIKTKN